MREEVLPLLVNEDESRNGIGIDQKGTSVRQKM